MVANQRQVASARQALAKSSSGLRVAERSISMKRQTRNMWLCVIFVAVSLIAICVAAAQAEHQMQHEEGKHKFHPYKYGYKVIDKKGNKQWKQEESHTPHEVKGSYGYKDKHGLFREVSYVADKHGFRAKIKTNEGKGKSSANAEVISEPNHHHGHGAEHGAGYGAEQGAGHGAGYGSGYGAGYGAEHGAGHGAGHDAGHGAGHGGYAGHVEHHAGYGPSSQGLAM